MTPWPDSYSEMGTDLPFDDPALTGVLDELRSLADGPVPAPTGALLALLDGDLASPTAGAPTLVPAPPSPRRKKMLVSDLLAGLATKLAGLGLAAKAALGLGVATAAVTTAGAVGVLPDPAQHAVSTVVNAISPLQLPDGNADVGVDAGVDVTVPTIPDVTLPGTGDDLGLDGDEDDGATHERTQNHGACVSAVARDHTTQGREHGAAVSEAARSDCGKDVTTTSSSSTTTSLPEDGEATVAQDNQGPGKSGGNGNSGRGGANRGPSNNSGSGRR